MPLDGRTQDFVPAETEVDEVGKVLLRAAEIVRERWLQDGYGMPGGAPVVHWGLSVKRAGWGSLTPGSQTKNLTTLGRNRSACVMLSRHQYQNGTTPPAAPPRKSRRQWKPPPG